MINKLTSRCVFLLLLAAGLASCESATTEPPVDNSAIKKGSLLVLNEGAFGSANASLDVVTMSSSERQANIIPNLGDVGSDVEILNGDVYVLSSNSKKLYVVSPTTGEVIDHYNFDAGDAPNAIALTGPKEALLTHLFAPGVDIVELDSNTVTGTLPTPGGTVDVVVHEGFVYVTGAEDSLYIFDQTTKAHVRSIYINFTPQRMFVDSENDIIYVTSWGRYDPPTNHAVVKINTATNSFADYHNLGTQRWLNNIVFGKDVLYYLYADMVEIIDPETFEVKNATFIDGAFLAGAYDEEENELYLGKGDYVTNGVVEVYDASTGALKRSIPAGIAPAHFAFYR